MIEEQLRDEFARRESEVPVALHLAPRIRTAARRRRRSQRVTRSAAAALAVVLVALGAPLVVRQRTAAAPFPLGSPVGDTALPAGPLNFIVVGLDQPSANRFARADAIIIAHVPADRSGLQLVTIPRDLRVDVPSRQEWQHQRMSGIYPLGGMPLIEEVLTNLTGLTFHGSIVADLTGLAGVVDQLGGIDFCLDQRVKSIHTGREYEVGCRTFGGDEMRDLLRQRKYLPNGAFDRERHNAQFVAALVKTIADDGVGDLVRLRALVESLRTYVTVDLRGLDPVVAAWELRNAAGSVAYTGMPVKAHEHHLGPGSNAASLFEALRTDTVPAWIAAHRYDPLVE